MNAADIDGLLGLYAEEVSFEDPVGADQRSGRDALRAHFEEFATAGIKETIGAPVAGQDGRHVLAPVSAVMDYLPKGPKFVQRGWLEAPESPEGKRITWNYVLMLRAGKGGAITELKALWGRSDIAVTD